MKQKSSKSFFGLIFFTLLLSSCFKKELKREIEELKNNVSVLQKRTDSLNNIMNQRADSLTNALKNSQKRTDSLSNILRFKADSISVALGITNATITLVSRSVDSIKTQLIIIETQKTLLNNKISVINEQIALINQQLITQSGNIAMLTSQYSNLAINLQEINNQIASLQLEQNNLILKLNNILLILDPPTDIKTGLIAFYPFTGSAADSSGNNQHGIATDVIPVSDRLGSPNAAFKFNGISSGVKVNSTLGLNLIGNFTISIWINPIQFKQNTFIVSKNGGVTGQGTWHFQIAQYGSLFQPHYNADPCFCTLGAAGNSSNVPLNIWSHLTVTYNASQSALSYYYNGTLINTLTRFNYTNMSTTYDFYIGRESGLNGSNTGFFEGSIDDVRLYSRLLTNKEIKYLAEH